MTSPDSGLDPVRAAYLSRLLIDINAQIDATILVVTHNTSFARTVPDNVGMLFRGELVMFGPREVLLTSDEPAVKQVMSGRRIGPIGMSEEKDESTMAEEDQLVAAGPHQGGLEEVQGVPPQGHAQPRHAGAQGGCPAAGPAARELAHAAQERAGCGPRRSQKRRRRRRRRPQRPLQQLADQDSYRCDETSGASPQASRRH